MVFSGSSGGRNLKDLKNRLNSLKHMMKELKRGHREVKSQIEVVVRTLKEKKRIIKEVSTQLSSAMRYCSEMDLERLQGTQCDESGNEILASIEVGIIGIMDGSNPLLTNLSSDANVFFEHLEEVTAHMNDSAMSVESTHSTTESLVTVESLDTKESLESLDSLMEEADSVGEEFGGPSFMHSDSSDEDSTEYYDSSEEESQGSYSELGERRSVLNALRETMHGTKDTLGSFLDISQGNSQSWANDCSKFQEVANEILDTNYETDRHVSSWINTHTETNLSEDHYKERKTSQPETNASGDVPAETIFSENTKTTMEEDPKTLQKEEFNIKKESINAANEKSGVFEDFKNDVIENTFRLNVESVKYEKRKCLENEEETASASETLEREELCSKKRCFGNSDKNSYFEPFLSMYQQEVTTAAINFTHTTDNIVNPVLKQELLNKDESLDKLLVHSEKEDSLSEGDEYVNIRQTIGGIFKNLDPENSDRNIQSVKNYFINNAREIFPRNIFTDHTARELKRGNKNENLDNLTVFSKDEECLSEGDESVRQTIDDILEYTVAENTFRSVKDFEAIKSLSIKVANETYPSKNTFTDHTTSDLSEMTCGDVPVNNIPNGNLLPMAHCDFCCFSDLEDTKLHELQIPPSLENINAGKLKNFQDKCMELDKHEESSFLEVCGPTSYFQNKETESNESIDTFYSNEEHLENFDKENSQTNNLVSDLLPVVALPNFSYSEENTQMHEDVDTDSIENSDAFGKKDIKPFPPTN